MRSLRTRLTLWNVAILAATLVTFGIGMLLLNQNRLSSEIDRELRERASRSRRPFEPGSRRRGGPRDGMGPPEERPFGTPMGPDQPAGPPPFDGLRPPGMDEEEFRILNLRRPRQFDQDMAPLSQPGDTPFDLDAAKRVMKSGELLYTNSVANGERVRVFTMPWRDQGDIIGVAQTARETRDLDRLWRAQLLTLAIFLPAALAVAGLGALFLTGKAMRPIRQMKESAERISGSNLSERLTVTGADEFAELSETFNDMIERLETSFGQLQEAYEHQRRFSADASHELRTPLTRLKLAASAALSESSTDEQRIHALKVAEKEADGMTKLVNQLLILAKADAGQLAFTKARHDLRVIASEAIDNVEPTPERISTDFQTSAVYADVDPDAIRRVIENLLENALRYAPDAPIKVEVSEANGAVVTIQDSGPGISSEHLPKLTESFYRADAARTGDQGGTGLGLSICKSIVEAHGGSLEIHSQVGQGTTAIVKFERISEKS